MRGDETVRHHVVRLEMQCVVQMRLHCIIICTQFKFKRQDTSTPHHNSFARDVSELLLVTVVKRGRARA